MLCRCNYPNSYLNLNLALNASAVGLLRGYSKIQFVDSGVLPWRGEPLSSSLYLTLANTGNITGYFTVMPNGCNGPDQPFVTAGPASRILAAGSSSQYFFPIGAIQDLVYKIYMGKESTTEIREGIEAETDMILQVAEAGHWNFPPLIVFIFGIGLLVWH